MTDPRSGLLPSVAPPGGEPSLQHLRQAWDDQELAYDLVVEHFVSLRELGDGLWRAHCTMCGVSSHVDLHDRARVGHGMNCVIASLVAARYGFGRVLTRFVSSLAERRQPDTPLPATVGQPSPIPVRSDLEPVGQIVSRLGARQW